MEYSAPAMRIQLADFKSPAMRAFHVTWAAFFLCFFAWFAIAPLMPVVRAELALSRAQVGATIIASVAATILARLAIGWCCDRFGPRLTYAWLLVLGSLPVMGIGLAHDFPTFLLFRLLIGVLGASFVVTQCHTSLMFAPNCIGTANAVTAGWGNLGGGAAQIVMPALLAALIGVLGCSEYWGWRLSMVLVGAACVPAGFAYSLLTQDTPQGDLRELRAAGKLPAKQRVRGSLTEALRDRRTWALSAVYAAAFGMELTIKNVAVLYFTDYHNLGLQMAGLAAGAYGLMNLFARPLGGYMSDRYAARVGLRGRSRWLCLALLGEGLALLLFAQCTAAWLAVMLLVVVALFVQMSCGATFAIVPLVNRRCLGSVTGVVGAAGNLGAVAAGFLFQGAIAWPTALWILGLIVLAVAPIALAVRLSPADASARSVVPSAEPDEILQPVTAT